MSGLTLLGLGPVTSMVVLGAVLAAAVAAAGALVGGVALGFGWFVVCSIAFGGALLHFAAPAERVEAEERR